MSINYFHILLLFLALQACHGRNLVDVDEEISGDKLQFSNQTEKKASNGANSTQPRTMNPEMGIPVRNEENRGKRLRDENSKVSVGFQMTRGSDSVSWRLPRKKHRFENPVFSLDYESPKTHPPTHN